LCVGGWSVDAIEDARDYVFVIVVVGGDRC
jgi:hypothetical protein